MKRYTLSDIQSLESGKLGKMSDKELKKLVSDSARIANARLKRLEQSGMSEFSRAYHSNVRKTHNHFGVGTKTKRASLRNEFKAIREFLNMKTSTVSGTKAVRNKVNKELGLTFTSPQKEKSFWRTYRKIEERGDVQGIDNGSPRVIERLYRVMNSAKEFRALIHDINKMNGYDYTDEDIERLTKNNIVITADGEEVKVSRRQEDLVYLLAEDAERLFREGWSQTHNDIEGEYRDISSPRRR